MDRPEELTCHRCRKPLGYVANDVFAQRCPDCKVFSQPGKGSDGVPADPEVLRLQHQLGQIDRDFAMAKKPYMVRVGGSTTTPGKDFDPLEVGVEIGDWFAYAVIGVGALVAAFYGFFLAAAGLIALDAWLIRAAGRVLKEKRSAYIRLLEQRDAARQGVLDEIYRRLG